MCSIPPLNIENLKNKIRKQIQKEMLLATNRREVIRRFQSCIENYGLNFEQFTRIKHLLEIILNCVRLFNFFFSQLTNIYGKGVINVN